VTARAAANEAGSGAPDLPPASLFAACEGGRCRPLEELEAELLSAAAAALGLPAARLRARGGVGRATTQRAPSRAGGVTTIDDYDYIRCETQIYRTIPR
jgi:hypothetical protein